MQARNEKGFRIINISVLLIKTYHRFFNLLWGWRVPDGPNHRHHDVHRSKRMSQILQKKPRMSLVHPPPRQCLRGLLRLWECFRWSLPRLHQRPKRVSSCSKPVFDARVLPRQGDKKGSILYIFSPFKPVNVWEHPTSRTYLGIHLFLLI